MKTLKTNSGKGKILKEKLGNVTCTKYEGEFSVPSLQEKSETGMWYTSLSGNPFAIQGEGNTPEDAIKDSIIRTKDYIKNMEIGLDLLTECGSLC